MKQSITLLLFLFVLSASAKIRTTEEKRMAALTALQKISNTSKTTHKAMAAAPGNGNNTAKNGSASSDNAAYGDIKELFSTDAITVMGFNEGGFAVLANDDRHDAVLAYSASVYEDNAGNTGFAWWMNAMNEVLEADGATRYAADYTPTDLGYTASVPGILSTTWGQAEPYNNFCPVEGTTICPTGCVATAMAQVLFYHKYPVKALAGKVSGYDAQLGSEYDWDNMLLSYTKGQYSEAEGEAVATLMQHCGATVKMQYESNGSGAYIFDVPYALKHWFGFNDNLTFRRRAIHTTRDWMDMIYKELSANRPIIYGGADPNGGGHAFVLDGYDEDGLVHVNWGWSGNADGYYEVALLNPGNYSFTTQQDMVIGVAESSEGIEYSVELGTQKDFLATLNGNKLTFDLTNYSIYNCHGGKEKNMYNAYVVLDDGVKKTQLVKILSNKAIQAPADGTYHGMNLNKTSTADVPADLADGTYRMYVAFDEPLNSTYKLQPLYYAEGVIGCYTLTKNGSTITLGEETSSLPMLMNDAAADTDTRVFTLDGRKVHNTHTPHHKGIYIKGGKKIIY